uniref:Uncharacterized protein n=1 Tax=Bactrocera dorsalis TaxID=27457 RepID=A0A034V0B7_BACDO
MNNYEYFDFESILLSLLTPLNLAKTARHIHTHIQTLEIGKQKAAHSYFVYLLERIDTHTCIYIHILGHPHESWRTHESAEQKLHVRRKDTQACKTAAAAEVSQPANCESCDVENENQIVKSG